MGYYIPNDQPLESRGATLIAKPKNLSEIPEDKALICEADNVRFKAFGLIYNQREFEDFSHPDGRTKRWFLMDKTQAHQLSNYNQN